MYREWASSRLVGTVAWTRTVGDSGASHRVLPDGCVDLIWISGTLLVAGPDTRAQPAHSPPGARYVALRFAPGTGPAVLGVPGSELRDQRVELAALWPAGPVRRLAARLAALLDRDPVEDAVEDRAVVRESVAVLESVALARWPAAGRPDPSVAALVRWLRAGAEVGAIAGRIGLSERQLHRRSLTLFGYGPKTLARVLRFDRALAMARTGTPFAEVAHRTGYADQAHLSREVKALAGVPLGALVGGATGTGQAVPPGAVPSGAGLAAKSSTLLPSGSWTIA